MKRWIGGASVLGVVVAGLVWGTPQADATAPRERAAHRTTNEGVVAPLPPPHGRPPIMLAEPSHVPLPPDPAEIRACATEAHKNDCDFLAPSEEVLEEMAACGVVRFDFPAMFAQRDWTPEFEVQWLDLVGASAAERDALMQIGDAYRDDLFAELEALAAQVDAGPWASDATLLAAVVELSDAVGDDAVRAASRRIAAERAGNRDAPGSSRSISPAERLVRRFTSIGDDFEKAVAMRFGDARARELRLAQDGWPGLKAQTGADCP